MKVITGPRQSGKTTEAIRIANKNDAHLVVHNESRLLQVRDSQLYPELKNEILTYNKLNNIITKKSVVIDDLDYYLKTVVKNNIEGVSITSNETINLK